MIGSLTQKQRSGSMIGFSHKHPNSPLWTPYGPPMFCACKREEGSIVVCGLMWGSDTRHTREPNDLHDPNDHNQRSPLTCRT